MKLGHLQNIQSSETCIETGNLQSYNGQNTSGLNIPLARISMSSTYLPKCSSLNNMDT